MSTSITSAGVSSAWGLTMTTVGPLGGMDTPTVWRVSAAEGEFVCKIARPWKRASQLVRDLTIFSELHTRGFTHAPLLRRTVEGNNFLTLNDAHYYLLSYIDGEPLNPSEHSYAQLGDLLGKLHAVTGFPFATDFDTDVIKTHLVARAPQFGFQSEYERVVAGLPSFAHLPRAVIHTDLSPANVVRRTDGELVLIDWDDGGMGTRVIDVAAPLINQFISEDGEVHDTWARAFADSYAAHHTLTEDERAVLFDAGIFWALNYLIYGDTEKRWARVQWALEHRARIESWFT